MIEFINCTIRSGNFYGFRNLNLRIEQDKHYRITGPNGSGKTLLAKTIAGKTQISEGEIVLSGNEVHLKDIVHYVPARTFEMLFGASDNVFYQQRYYSVANRDVQSVADFLGDDIAFINQWKSHPHFDISSLYPVKLTSLSNGQLRKLVLLKSMANQPRVLVMDYPYEGLDRTSRIELNELLKEIVHSINCSLLIVDNLNELPNLDFEPIYVDECKIMADGRSKPEEEILLWNRKNTALEPETLIKCNNIQVKYGDKHVIQNFSWSVNKGDRWLLSGDNGSGKSTILSLLFADHPQAYKNDIYLWDKKRGGGESIWDIKNKISFLSAEMFTYASNSFKNNQNVTQFLLTHFQGPFEMENLDFKELRKKAEQMLEYFGLNKISNMLFRNLSSGQKQLLLIIRTFLFKRSLILLDEPFQFLDFSNKVLAKQFIHSQLNDEDTLIVISHHKDKEFTGISNIKHM